jgi:hypothetical protein
LEYSCYYWELLLELFVWYSIKKEKLKVIFKRINT